MRDFLTQVSNSGINAHITDKYDLDEAAKKFQEMLGEILDHHAPVRTFQIHKHYVTYLSEETKLLM